MESSINPFTPSFGKVPPILAGRKILIGEFEQAFSLNPTIPICVACSQVPAV